MTHIDCKPFDFRKAGYVEESLGREIRNWSTRAIKVFRERWREMAPTPIEIHLAPLTTLEFGTLIAGNGQPSVGSILNVGKQGLTTMIVIEQADLLSLILEILCDAPSEKPAPRNLTSVESQIAQLLMETFASAISEAWPAKEPLPTSIQSLDFVPHRSRLLVGTEFVVVAPFCLKTRAGEVRLQWAMPRESAYKFLSSAVAQQPAKAEVKPVDVVSQIPLELVVALGKCQIPMTDLENLAVGDVLILDQRIDMPLPGLIDNQPFCQGWPGRIGTDQAFKISQVLPK